MAIGPKSFDFRESTRTPVRTEVHLQFDRDEDVVGYSANLSPGGIFITLRDPKPIGTLLRFSISLPDEDPVRGYGEVTWIRVKYHGPDRPSGMGIRFRHLEDDGKERVEQFILSMTLSEPEADTGEDTVAAVPEASPAIASALQSSGTAQGASESPEKGPDPDETLAALTAEEPMAEVWLAEEGEDGDETLTPTTSELLLPPALEEEPAPEVKLPTDEIDTVVYPELAVAETIEVPIARASDEGQFGADAKVEFALGDEESADDLSIDTAVIDEDELFSVDPLAAARESLSPAGERVGTDELSAVFGDLYPADRHAEKGEGDAEGAPPVAVSQPPAASREAAPQFDLDAGARTQGAGDDEDLPRPAPWLTTPVPDLELEETLDGLLRETEQPAVATPDDPLRTRPRSGVVAQARERSDSPVWTELPREVKKPESGRPPGSSRTSIAGAARVEERWKKTFFGMPSRTFLRLVVGLAVLALVGFFFAGWVVDWIGKRGAGDQAVATEGGDNGVADRVVADRVVADSVVTDSVATEPDADSPTTTPAAVDSANSEVAAPSSEQPLADPEDATAQIADDHFSAAVLATEDGGLDLTRLQLEEGATVRRLLALHARSLVPRAMRQVTDLVWRQRGDETIVTITGDGALEAGRYSQEEIPGAQSRAVIRVRGILGDFPQPTSQVNTPQLSVIRLEYSRAGQRELQVVLDLPHADVEVSAIELTGAGLEIHLSVQ